MPVVPTHPLTTPDPDVLRWVVPDGLLPFTGGVAHAPALLQGLLDDGTLSAVQVEDGAVLTLLGDGRSWRREGARVRTALVDALGAPRSWRGVTGAHDVGPDEVLEAAARQIADGPVGAFARSHGGAGGAQRARRRRRGGPGGGVRRLPGRRHHHARPLRAPPAPPLPLAGGGPPRRGVTGGIASLPYWPRCGPACTKRYDAIS